MIGAHNILSAYRTRKWWMRPFAFAHKCQSKRLLDLTAMGVQFFDIRVCYRNYRAWGAHGIAEYDVNVYNVLKEISDNFMYPTVRIILEKGSDTDKLLFRNDCDRWQELYPNVKFIGGNFKPTWERIYTFENDDVRDNIVQYVGSMQTWWGKLCPWLYAKLYNDKNFARAMVEPSKYYLFDFL